MLIEKKSASYRCTVFIPLTTHRRDAASVPGRTWQKVDLSQDAQVMVNNTVKKTSGQRRSSQDQDPGCPEATFPGMVFLHVAGKLRASKPKLRPPLRLHLLVRSRPTGGGRIGG